MLAQREALFPQVQGRYSSLPLLGSIIDSFATWLAERGYRKITLRVMLRPMVQIDRWLRRHDVERISDLDVDILEACWTTYHPRSSNIGGVIRALAKYLDSLGVLQHSQVDPQTPSEQLVSAYAEHLDKVRGFSQSSIRNRLRTASQFLGHIRHDAQSPGVHGVTPSDIESFVRQRGHELTRASLQQLVAHLRGFLRFLAMVGKVSPSLAEAIDTPRIYRREKLPRSLPWETVKALLESIDRSTGDGLRDYTMLLLIAAYGLRVSEVAALTLDGIHWRQRWLQVPQRKSRSPLPLPLTDTVGSALVHYLREGRPKDVTSRHLFLRSRAPIEPLKPTGVTMVFERWARRSGLEIPFFGAHCLRHSYAVHLLRSGASIKTIGDLLGHRYVDSTSGYLRLATEDLRDVALPMPKTSPAASEREV